MRPVFENAGDIRSVDLLASFVSLWRDNASGELRFSRSGASAGFEFRDGEIVASHSSQSHFDVAAILERGGKLDPAAAERLEKAEGGDPAIAALQAGLITVREWKWGQKIRAIEILSDLLGWLEGEYTYDPTILPEPGDWTLPVPRLVLELFLRSRDRTLVEHCLGPSDLPLVRSESFEEEFETFGLTADAGSVIKLIDGKATAEEIAAKAPAEEFAVLKLLAALTTLGLVHPREAAAAKPPPAPKKRKRETAKAASPTTEAETAVPEASREVEIEGEPAAEPVMTPSEPTGAAAAETPAAPEELEGPPEELAEPSEELPPPVPAGEERRPVLPPERVEPEPAEKPLPVLPFDPVSTPADLMSEPYEAPPRELRSPIDEQEQEFGGFEPPSPPPPPTFEPPASGGGRGSGGLLAGLIAVLVIAIAVVVVMRVRSRSVPGAPAGAVTPTPRDLLVFPPAETAVPLPRRGRIAATATPTSVPRTPTVSPTTIPSPTARPAAIALTKTPTPSPTRPAPTKTSTVTRTATRPAPTKTPTATRTPPPPSRTGTATATNPPPTKTRTPTATRPAPTKTFTPVPTRAAATRTPTPRPTATPTRRPPATARATPAPATKAPTRAVPTKTPTPVPTQPPSTTTVAGETGRGKWIRRAERDRQALSKRRNARYAVQLELACEIETLEKAWAWDNPSGTMWLLTTPYRGRTCFRVMWGHYATLAQAQAARAKVPSFFVVPGNRPVPVLVR